MNRAEFEESCKKADAALKEFSFSGDAKEDLRNINDCIKIVRVSRIVKRARSFVASAIAVAGGAGLIVGGIIGGEKVLMIAAIIIGAFMIAAGAWYFFAHLGNLTHKAVCIIENGKVSEYIFSRKGGFLYNTVEGALVCERGKIFEDKRKQGAYEPGYPYVDFLDRDFSNFLKARTGEGYDGGEVYEHDRENGAIYAYTDESKKKKKFALCFDGNMPYKMEYLTRESYVYSHMNDAGETVYLPTAVRGRLTPPPFLNVEYVDFSKDYGMLWARL